ncbi:unnamed protein product [Fraxinus pennsylvanica]|uniref:Pentatricopeptide repeat-containing protein n=1 Tax=Fraxinus pennsylvanica TaxID=56036 RepID=A0AAD2AAB7_9LAMI|nr:unnamed protein product [Fraxinus pennsylvanica]
MRLVFNINNYVQLLEACISSKSLKQGKTIHQHLIKLSNDFSTQSLLLDKLTRLYISCNKPQVAERVFNSIPISERRNKNILWNQMIRAYAWDGPFEKAIDLYYEMVDSGVVPTKFTYPFVLKACSALQDVENGVKIYGHVKRLNLGCDVYVWFSIHGLCLDAIRLVLEMQQMGVNPNSSTVVAILPAIGEAGRWREGKAIHGFCLRKGFDGEEVVGTGLLDMYGKCGWLVYARRIFGALRFKNEITWTSMIGAFVICDAIREGLDLFRKMRVQVDVSPSHVMLATVIRGCAKLSDLNLGRQMYCYTVKLGYFSNLMLWRVLVTNNEVELATICPGISASGSQTKEYTALVLIFVWDNTTSWIE